MTATKKARRKKSDANGLVFIGGYIDADIVTELDRLAKKDFRGNMTLAVEKILSMGVKHLEAIGEIKPNE